MKKIKKSDKVKTITSNLEMAMQQKERTLRTDKRIRGPLIHTQEFHRNTKLKAIIHTWRTLC